MATVWYDTHDIPGRILSDGSNRCSLRGSVSKGKQIVIAHAGTEHGFVPGIFLLCGKKLSDIFADCHAGMNGNVLEEWFKIRLLPNLPEKCVIILDNASYHCRQVEKIPTKSTLKRDIVKFMLDHGIEIPQPTPIKAVKRDTVKFMSEHGIEIPQPTPIKAVVLERIKVANIKKRYIIDEMALKKGHKVLRLPPYHCCLNAIEMVCHQLKSNVRHNNDYSDKPEKVLDLISDVCDEII